MTLRFIHVYFSPNPSKGYKILRSSEGKTRKEIKCEIEYLKIFNRFRGETATRVWPSRKVDRTKIQFKGSRHMGKTEQDGSSW
jgi:hypothetical protein